MEANINTISKNTAPLTNDKFDELQKEMFNQFNSKK